MSLSSRQIIFMVILAILSISIALIISPTTSSGSGSIADIQLSDTELIEKGEYLATAGNCVSCHTAEGGELMAGGLPFETPFGVIYSTNITPDLETGIGDWTEWDFLNSVRHGVNADGQHLYPAFPYTAYTKLSNEDIAAIFAYLKSLPAQSYTPPANELGFPFNQRALMGFWKFLFFEAGEFSVDESKSDSWNRGAYLVEALTHCSACHSPRNVLGAEQNNLAMSGGEYLDRVGEGMYRPWSAPNLTSSQHGLGLWSQIQLEDYLGTSRNDFIESFGPMNEVIVNSTSKLRSSDIGAMATYLKDLTAIEETPGAIPDALTMGRGRTVYNLHCGTCHLPTGEGDPEMAPRLNRGSLVIQDSNPASMINAILYAPQLPAHGLEQRWREPMEEYQYLLDDEEVAAAATYIRNSWENEAGLVTPEQVARQR